MLLFDEIIRTPLVNMGASTRGFWQISHICINFHRKDMKNFMNLVIPWPKRNFKHPQFEIPIGGLAIHHSYIPMLAPFLLQTVQFNLFPRLKASPTFCKEPSTSS